MTGLKALAAALSVVLPITALGAQSPQDCATIAKIKERVSCYDSFFLTPAQQEITTTVIEAPVSLSPVQARQREEVSLRDRWFSITPHRPNYILPATYNGSADHEQYGSAEEFLSDTELKFQLSLKTTLLTDLWRDSTVSVAYTQQSHWQLYADEELSAPFRETNHEPEIMWQIPVDFRVLGFDARFATLAFNHQSNGRSRPLSRSWNRLSGEVVLERGRFVLSAKTWVRVDDPDPDDNPDIEDFMGRIQLGAAYKHNQHTFALGLKNSLDGKMRSGVEFNWLYPLSRHLKGFVQLYSGYGENLIDMEHYTNRVGIGLALTDWL